MMLYAKNVIKELTTMTPEAINRLDIYMRCRMQANQLSNKNLALKFETTERRIIHALRNGSSKGLTPDDIKLIYACQSERDQLRSIAAQHSPKVLLRDGLAKAAEIQTYLRNHEYQVNITSECLEEK